MRLLHRLRDGVVERKNSPRGYMCWHDFCGHARVACGLAAPRRSVVLPDEPAASVNIRRPVFGDLSRSMKNQGCRIVDGVDLFLPSCVQKFSTHHPGFRTCVIVLYSRKKLLLSQRAVLEMYILNVTKRGFALPLYSKCNE